VAGNRFVFAQLKHGSQWDPYPSVWPDLSAYLVQTTSLTPWAERRVVGLDDPALYESPFVLLTGRGEVRFSDEQGESLRRFIAGGGFLLIDNAEADRAGPFARTVPPAVQKLFPGAAWEPLSRDFVAYRSFFLLRGTAGRRIADIDLRGLRVQGRVAAIYCANDLQGAVARDQLGNYLYACEPGGDAQRVESLRLLVNLVMYSLTGTYKTDAIHQPFLEQKLRQ
jgi:hypothetical protein